MEEKSSFVSRVENNPWAKWLIRIAFLIWAVVLLSYFFWSQVRFFADRLKPFLALIGL